MESILSRISMPYITRDFTYVSARTANPRDEIREPRRETRPDIRRRITAARVGARIKAKNGRIIRKGLCECRTSARPPRAHDPVTHFSFQPYYAASRVLAVINEVLGHK